MIEVYFEVRRLEAEDALKDLESTRAAVASVMGGRKGHSLFMKIHRMLRRAINAKFRLKELKDVRGHLARKLIALGASNRN